ncbi:peptidase U34 [Rhodovibrio salinarum]|uniref:Dipeptidase n=2 Tax=Rhodovibrio salinarum TaxID=1087 RepID=A0A934QGI8_9PROT|nr:peptidase U34 [Rhodovibrio salinarum]
MPANAQPETPEPVGHPNSKSLGIYIGHELTADGSTLVGGFGHEPSSHWIEIVPRRSFPEDATMKVGVTDAARIPGELTTIPQARQTAKYITSNYSEFAGFPPPLTNGGLNEYGVAARDIWSPSRQELVDIAKQNAPQSGPNYSDLARVAMERATSAREAAALVGRLIDEHGFSTYGGNSHLFADSEEAWVFINYAAKGLWAAKRIGPDEVRVMYPGYIHAFPADFKQRDGYMGSDNLVSFAREQGWWDGEGSLNLQEVYGKPFPADVEQDYYPQFYADARNPVAREAELREMAPVSVKDLMAYVRDPRWSTDFTGYSQVAHIRPDAPKQLHTLWTAITSGITTPFVPIPIATTSVPPEFSQHRYMTKNASSHFLDPDYGPLEATRYATRTFKRLLYHTCEHPSDFLHPVTGEIERFETGLLAQRDDVEARAKALLADGKTDAMQRLLTRDVHDNLLASLNLGQDLVQAVEQQTRTKYGIRMPEGERAAGETTPATSQAMARHGWGAMIHCYQKELDEYPRPHGLYNDSPDLTY